MHDAHPLLRQAGIPALIALAALLLTVVFWPLCQWFPAALFLLGVMVAGWRWGVGSGLTTTAMALLPLLFMYRSTLGESAPTPWGEALWRLALFALVGALASYLSHLCRRAVNAVDRFHCTLATVHDAMIIADPFCKVCYLNPAAESLTGCKLEDAVDRPLEEVFRCVHDDSRQPVSLPTNRVIGDGLTLDLPPDAVLLTGVGREFCIDGRMAPHRDEKNQVAGLVIACRDVTKRRQEERECRQREEQFRTLASCAPVGLVLLDTQGRCTLTNAAWHIASGLKPEECLNDGWARVLHPEDRGRLVTDWLHAVRSGRDFTGEFRLQPRRGETRWLRLRSAPMLSQRGQLLGHIGVLEDIDALKQAELCLRESENKFTAFMRHLPGPALLKDAEGRYLFANEPCARAFDWEPGGWDQQTDAELLPKGHKNPFCDQEEQVLEERVDHEGHAVLNRQGGRQTFLVRQFAVPAGNDSDVFFGSMAIDLSAQKEAEQALRDAREDFERRWNERANDLKRSEEALKKTRTDLEKHLAECSARQKQSQEALQATRQELEQRASAQQRQVEEFTNSRRKSEEALKAATELLDEQAVEQQQALQGLRAELASRTNDLEALRSQQAENAAAGEKLQTLVAERQFIESQAERLSAELAQLSGEHEKLRAEREQSAKERSAREASTRQLHDEWLTAQEDCAQLRQELERLGQERSTPAISLLPRPRPSEPPLPRFAKQEGEVVTHQILVNSWRLVEGMDTWRTAEVPTDWLSYN